MASSAARKRWTLCITLSVLVHLILFGLIRWQLPEATAQVALPYPCQSNLAPDPVDSHAAAQCLPAPQAPRLEDLELRLLYPSDDVETDDQAPDDARYAGESNVKVEKESMPSLDGMPLVVPVEPPPPEHKAIREASEESTPKDSDAAAPTREEMPRVADSGATAPEKAPTKEGAPEDREPSPDEPQETAAEQASKFDLSIAKADWHRVFSQGGAPIIDYAAKVEDVGVMAVNQRQTQYASFWNRIRRQVSGQWAPDVAYAQHDPTFEIYPHITRTTVLRVKLNAFGQILHISVKDGSGLKFLDEEAKRAMLAAAPFPNPPEGLKDSDGTLQFEFGFVVEWISGTRSLFYRIHGF